MSMSISELEELARKCRVEIVKMVHRAQAGHPGARSQKLIYWQHCMEII